MKRIAILLALLIAIPAFAAWKFNPHTGKLDYYESGGPPGPAGDNGVGVPAGGTTGQILEKIDNTDYNTQWGDPPTAGLHAGTHVTGGGDTIADAVAAGNSGLMSGADKTKLDGIAAGAEVNVNADWNAGSGDAQILNKPTIPADISGAKYVTTQAEGGLSAEAVLPTCSGTDKLTFNGTTISCGADVSGGGTPSGTVASETTYGLSSNAGATSDYSRGDHTHGSVSLPTLDQIGNPAGDKTFSMATRTLKFSFVNPTGADGAFEIESTGAYTGDLLHIHQHTGNPGVSDLVHLESADADVLTLRISSGATIGLTINKQIESSLATGTAPFSIASTTKTTNLNADLLDDLSSADFALAGAGVTGGNSHDHNGGDGAQIAYGSLSGLPTLPSNEAGASNNFLTAYNSGTGAFSKAQPTWANIDKSTSSIADITTRSHTSLTDIGTNAHSAIDTFISSKAAASGLASLDGSTLVVQNPANATATATASKIPIADGSGKLDTWVSDASETVKGKAELATDAEAVTGTATGVVTTPANVRAAYTPTNIASTPGADHTSTGPTTNALNAGGTITIMDLVILNSSSQWVATDANASGTTAGMLAISLESKTSGQAMKVALPGSFVRDDTWNWTPGAVLYVSETASQITATQPTTADVYIRVIGYAITADVIYFMPSPDWIQHT